MMADTSFLDYVLEQLAEARGLKTRSMFGGHGLYIGDSFFGIVHKGALYFRTDEATRPAYVKAGSRPFNPKGRAAPLRAPVQGPKHASDGRARMHALGRERSGMRSAAGTGRPARGAGRVAGKVAQPPSYELTHRYYEVPSEVLEDAEELLVWAKRATKTRD